MTRRVAKDVLGWFARVFWVVARQLLGCSWVVARVLLGGC